MKGISFSRAFVFFILAATAILPPFSWAAEVVLEPPPGVIGRTSFSTRSITLSKAGSADLKVSEFVSPLFVRKPIGRDGEVSIYLSGGSATSNGDLTDSDLSGFTDVELSGSKRFDSGRYWIGGGVTLPTGKALIEANQVVVTGVVANRILGLRLKRFGEGPGLFASGARAFTVTRSITASLGAGFQYKGEYDYLKGEEGDETVRIKPGNEAFFAAGVSGALGAGSARFEWKGDLRYRLFSKDERNGEVIYEEGDQVEFLASAGLRIAERQRLDGQLFFVVKGKGTDVEGVGEGDIETMTLEEYLQQGLPGGMQQAMVRYGRELSDRFDIRLFTSYSHFSEFAFPGEEPAQRLLGSANLLDLGAGVIYYIADKTTVTLDGAYLTGNAEEGAVDMSGFDAAVTLQWIY